jgi:hypothetical protein
VKRERLIAELDTGGRWKRTTARRERRVKSEDVVAVHRPARGRAVRWGGRAPSGVVTRPWRGASNQVCGLYPFLSADPLPAAGIPLGIDVHAGCTFAYAPALWVEHHLVENPNVLLTGRPGSGKSTAAKLVTLRGAVVGVRTLIAGDLKGEYNELARWLGVEPTILGGSRVRLNPLDAGPLGRRLPSDATERQERIAEVHRRRLVLLTSLAAMAVTRPVTSEEEGALSLVLERTEAGSRTNRELRDPLIAEVISELEHVDEGDAKELWFDSLREFRDGLRPVLLGLRGMLDGALGGVFDGATTHPLDFDAPIQTVDISRLEARGEVAVAGVLACLSSWSQAAIDDPDADEKAPSRQLVRDEMWRHLKFPWLTQKVDSDLRLSRKQGVVQFLVTHELGDFDAAADPETARLIARKCSIQVTYAQDVPASSKVAEQLGLNATEREMVGTWTAGQRGRGLWRIGPRRRYVVQTRLHPVEKQLTHTDEMMRV